MGEVRLLYKKILVLYMISLLHSLPWRHINLA